MATYHIHEQLRARTSHLRTDRAEAIPAQHLPFGHPQCVGAPAYAPYVSDLHQRYCGALSSTQLGPLCHLRTTPIPLDQQYGGHDPIPLDQQYVGHVQSVASGFEYMAVRSPCDPRQQRMLCQVSLDLQALDVSTSCYAMPLKT